MYLQEAGGKGNGTPLQYSCLEIPWTGAWQSAIHGVAKNRTRLSGFTFTFYFHTLEKDFHALVDFPGVSDGKASAYNVGDPGSIPRSGRSPGEGNGNLLQYSCLENPMEGGAWQATVHGVAKSRTRLSDFTHLGIIILYIKKCYTSMLIYKNNNK